MSEAGYGHLHPSVRGFAEAAAEVRLDRIRAVPWIEHPAAARVLDILQEVYEQPRRDRMENVFFVGESGMGKTMLIKAFARKHAAGGRSGGVLRRPVVVMLMPADPTPDGFFNQLLKTLEAPVRDGWRERIARKQDVATAMLQECGTKVLAIDEVNSLLAGTPRQQRLFLQLLRFLSNDLGLALVCAGVPEARGALTSDPQLRSRFAEVELPPWTADADFQVFVNRLVSSLPLRRPSPVDSPKVRRLLIERSGGITIHVCKALERAAIGAVRSGRELIDLGGLEDEAVWRGIAPSRTGSFIAAQRRPAAAERQ
jgi:type II secretory pathway predicted ATPase ExeA